MKFIHLTDTHVVGGGQTIFGADPANRLAQAISSINTEHGDAEFVVITGDLTHWGDAEAYATFSREVSKLDIPLHLMVGNHDVTESFAAAFPQAARDNDGFVQSSLETAFGRCMFLDTHAEGTHAGEYCERRRGWLKTQLEADDAPIFLFMHHPPLRVGIRGMDNIMLQEAGAFFDVVKPHIHRIRHLFFGHVHRALFGNWRGISFSCMRGLNHQVGLDLSGSVDGIAADLANPAYGIVLIDNDCVIAHMHDFADNSPKFLLGPLEGGDAKDWAL